MCEVYCFCIHVFVTSNLFVYEAKYGAVLFEDKVRNWYVYCSAFFCYITIPRHQCWFYYNTETPMLVLLQYKKPILTSIQILLQYFDTNVGFITIQGCQCWFYYNTETPMLV